MSTNSRRSMTRRKEESRLVSIESKLDRILQVLEAPGSLVAAANNMVSSTPSSTPSSISSSAPSSKAAREYPSGLQNFNKFVKEKLASMKRSNPETTYAEALELAAPEWREKKGTRKVSSKKSLPAVVATPGRMSPTRNLAANVSNANDSLENTTALENTTPLEPQEEEANTSTTSLSERKNTPYPALA